MEVCQGVDVPAEPGSDAGQRVGAGGVVAVGGPFPEVGTELVRASAVQQGGAGLLLITGERGRVIGGFGERDGQFECREGW